MFKAIIFSLFVGAVASCNVFAGDTVDHGNPSVSQKGIKGPTIYKDSDFIESFNNLLKKIEYGVTFNNAEYSEIANFALRCCLEMGSPTADKSLILEKLDDIQYRYFLFEESGFPLLGELEFEKNKKMVKNRDEVVDLTRLLERRLIK